MPTTADLVIEALRPHKLKDEGSGKWRCNSPLRPGADSHSFSLKLESDGEHGAWKDHVSGESGSLYDLAQRLHISLPDRTEIQSTKRSYRDRAEYAEAHGVDDSVFEAAGWVQVTKDNRPALKFTTATGDRWRFLDGDKPYYKSITGYKRCWYGLTRAIDRVRSGHPLVICNGEASTVIAQHYGLAACCVPAGENALPEDLLSELLEKLPSGATVLIAYDCLDKGEAASKQVESQLVGKGVAARAIDLRLSKGGDLADFCHLFGASAGDKIATMPPLAATGQRRGRLYTLADLKQLPKPTWLVPGEIPAQGLAVFYGRSGIGKTFVMLDYAHKVAREHNVVYAALEGKYGFSPRIDALNQFHKVKADDLKLRFWVDPLDLSDKASLECFIQQIQQWKPVMVIIDTLSRAIGMGDPNNPRDMGMFVTACETIQNAINGVVCLVHHTRKSDSQFSGSQVLFNSAETFIQISNSDGLIMIEADKVKDAEPFPRRYMKMVTISLDDGSTVPVVHPAERVLQTANEKLYPNQLKILETIATVFPDGAPVSDLCDVTEIGKGSLLKTLATLRRLGFIDQNTPRSPYNITDSGLLKIGMSASDAKMSVADSLDSSRTPPRTPLPSSRIYPAVTPANAPRTPWTPQKDNFSFSSFSNSEKGEESKESGSPSRPESPGSPRQRSLLSLSSQAPTTPCPKCGHTDYKPHPVFGWQCRECAARRQLEETQSDLVQ